MGHNRTSQGAKQEEGLPPFKALQHGEQRLRPFAFETRWISPPTALKPPHGDPHHSGYFALSAQNPTCATPKNLNVDTA